MEKIKRAERRSVDFSEHNLWSTEYGDGGYVQTRIWGLKKDDSRVFSVEFINCRGVMTVTGDFGNFVFCREFHPSKDGYVSDGYWLEKLRMGSCQKPCVFDGEKTRDALAEFEKSLEDQFEGEVNGAEYEEAMEYVKACIDASHDVEWEYDSVAYGDKPEWLECEDVPKGHILADYLNAVFDAFDEICRRMGEKEGS